MIRLEHVNITVRDPHKTAAWMGQVFGWHIRWEGAAMNGQGYTIHVGTKDSYVALYAPADTQKPANSSLEQVGGLNHIAVVVDNLAEIDVKVSAYFKTHSHADYEPGTRFYFHDDDQVEYEVVCYA